MISPDWFRGKAFTRMYRAILVCAALGYGVLCFSPTVWADEAYSLALIAHPFREVWQITAADVHPPLYYFLLKAVMAPFGYAMPAGRVISVLPCLLVLAFGGRQLERLFDGKTALMFMVLYLAFPFSLAHAAELRMYSLTQLTVVLCAVYGYRCYRFSEKKDWVLFALSGAACAYTHYFALVSAGVIYGLLFLAILLHKRPLWKPWALASLLTAVLYIPWLGSFLSQLAYKVSNDYWISPITFGSLWGYTRELFGNGVLEQLYAAAAGMYLVCVVLLLLGKAGERTAPLLALSVPLLTAALGIGVSLAIRPIFIARYLLPCVPLLMFTAAWVLTRTSLRVVAAVYLAVAMLGGAAEFASQGKAALRVPNYALSRNFVEATGEAQCYAVISGADALTSQVLAAYAPEKMVYSCEVLQSGNPFPNWVDYKGFKPDDWDCFVLFLESGEALPQELDAFQAEYLKNFDVYGCKMDAWMMRKDAAH